jgi:hypothetical protein
MDQICDLIREELWGKHVREILIVSNLHPKMLKKGTLDNPKDIIKYLPKSHLDVAYENAYTNARIALFVMRKILNESDENGITKENMLELAPEIEFAYPGQNKMVSLSEILPNVYTFHGIPVINYKPLSMKHEAHRCTLVAPYDTGQEMKDSCDIPNHCGINFSFDGFWPCSNGSAIARLFKLDKKYRRDKLPKSVAEWSGIDRDGNADTKNGDMSDLCRLCQVSAKKPMTEKEHGRPISISYRKALGLEGSEEVSKHVIEGHKKRLAPDPIFKEVDNFEKNDHE